MHFVFPLIFILITSTTSYGICWNHFQPSPQIVPIGPNATMPIHIQSGKINPQLLIAQINRAAAATEVRIVYKSSPSDNNVFFEASGRLDNVTEFSHLIDQVINNSGTATSEYFGPFEE